MLLLLLQQEAVGNESAAAVVVADLNVMQTCVHKCWREVQRDPHQKMKGSHSVKAFSGGG